MVFSKWRLGTGVKVHRAAVSQQSSSKKHLTNDSPGSPLWCHQRRSRCCDWPFGLPARWPCRTSIDKSLVLAGSNTWGFLQKAANRGQRFSFCNLILMSTRESANEKSAPILFIFLFFQLLHIPSFKFHNVKWLNFYFRWRLHINLLAIYFYL